MEDDGPKLVQNWQQQQRTGMLKLLVRKFLPVLFLQSEAGRKLRGKLEGQGKQLLQTAKEKLEYFTFLVKTCPGNIDR